VPWALPFSWIFRKRENGDYVALWQLLAPMCALIVRRPAKFVAMRTDPDQVCRGLLRLTADFVRRRPLVSRAPCPAPRCLHGFLALVLYTRLS
jgi:hypothetical protein